jgi:hypothetical protein
MKKILSLALLSMSFAFFGDSADEALFVNHPVFVNPFRQIDDSSVDEETILELSEGDVDDDADELSVQDAVKINHASSVFSYNFNHVYTLNFKQVANGSVVAEQLPLDLSIVSFEGSSRAPPVNFA